MGVYRHRLGMVERADLDPNHVLIGISRRREKLIKQQAATLGTETFVLNGRRPVELRLALGESERGSRKPYCHHECATRRFLAHTTVADCSSNWWLARLVAHRAAQAPAGDR